MADNIQTPVGSGSDPAVATDDVGGAHYQKIKIALGAENAIDTLLDSGQQTMANSAPVAIASDQTAIAVSAPVATPVNVQIGDGTRQATVRDTGASDSLNVAIVDASGNQITSFGGGTQYTEDAASAADPVGNQLIARRRDSLATETSADGDVTALNSTAKGELYIKHVDAIPVTDNAGSLTVDGTVTANQGGTWTVQPGNTANTTPWLATISQGGNTAIVTSGGNLQVQARGVDAHDAPVTANPVAISGVSSAAAPADVSADGDAVRAWFLRNGAQAVTVTAAGALIGGDAANGLDVDVTRLPALPAGTNNIGDVDVVSFAAGAITEVQGDVAHDAAVSGNPVLIGAEARSTEGTAVASGDATRLQADLAGKLVIRPHAIPEQQVSGVASATGTGDTSVIAAQGAGVRTYVTAISIANSSANNPVIEIKDGTTVVWRTIAPANGGSNMRFDPPLRLTANTALNMAALTASTTVYFSANGYKGA